MKRSKSFKKAVSIILVVLMMFTVMSSGVSAFAATERLYTIEDTYYTASPDEVVAAAQLLPLDEYLVEQFSTCPGSVFVDDYKIPTGNINELASLIYDNCPELFHVASLQYYPVNGYIYTLIPTYSCTPEEYAEKIDACEKSADKLLEGIKGNDSLAEVEKALLLHDRIAELCEYDYENYLNGEIPQESYNMYGTLVNQTAVCQGYAETYLYLLRQVGIDSYICESDALNHAWNIVEIDGEEYHVDITWDDPTWDITGRVEHDNFLRSSEGIYATGHEATDYITTPVSTTYDDYFWQNSQAAFQLLDDEIYYIDSEDAYIRRYSDNSDVKNVSDTWMTSATSYYPGCFARLDTDGERLLYTSSKAVFALDAETGDTEEIWRPEGETEYHRIYGFRYEDNYLICDLNKTPNFAADTKTLYQQKKLYPEVEIVDSGVCGENATWTLDAEGTLTVSGTGEFDDNIYNYMGYYAYRQDIKTVVIENGIERIGYEAFYQCKALTAITIPESVTSIDERAFLYCESLTSITIPEGVTSIGVNAFAMCKSLISINVDEDNTAYSSDADGVLFNKDKTVLVCYPCGKTEEEYTIPATVTAVGDNAFVTCESLTSITIPEGVTSIGEYAFLYCESLTSITIPEGVTSLAEGVFTCCESLESIAIPESVTSIDIYAFDRCTSLTSITIPESVTSIDMYAFSCCESLTSVTISESVTSLAEGIFYACTALKSVTIPESVTSIGVGTFTLCESLTSITIPESVTSIGKYAFYYCTSLTDVYYGGSEAQWNEIAVGENNESLTNATIHFVPEADIVDSGVCGDDLTWTLDAEGTLTVSGTGDMYDFDWSGPWGENSEIKSVVISDGATSIGENAFSYCTGITSVSIPASVSSIGFNAFSNCSALTSVVIPDGVTDIGECAFRYCEALADIELPGSVTAIGENAFAYCTALEGITIPASVSYIGAGAFYCAESLTSITVDEDNTAYCSDADGVLFNKDKTVLVCYPCGKTEEEYTIPATVTSVGDYAFSGSVALKNITMSDVMTTIGEGAFELCHGLTNVEIPEGVTYLGMFSFGACSNLKTVHIPVSVTVIDRYAFDSSKKLTDVYYGGSETQWNEIAIGTSNNPLINATIHFTCKHSYSAVVTPPTCTAQGYTTYTCACGDIYIADYTDATDHSYSAVVTPPTCVEQGYTTYTCACGDSYVADYTGTVDHSYTGVITAPATHTEEGIRTFTCDVCGDTYTEAIAKTPAHSYSAVVTAPTCIEQGFTTYTCVCGSVYMDNFTDAVPHADADGDSFCDYCGEDLTVDPSENCSCMCHKDGFMGFIWKIVKFFWKIFGMNPVCECGKAHY